MIDLPATSSDRKLLFELEAEVAKETGFMPSLDEGTALSTSALYLRFFACFFKSPMGCDEPAFALQFQQLLQWADAVHQDAQG